MAVITDVVGGVVNNEQVSVLIAGAGPGTDLLPYAGSPTGVIIGLLTGAACGQGSVQMATKTRIVTKQRAMVKTLMALSAGRTARDAAMRMPMPHLFVGSWRS